MASLAHNPSGDLYLWGFHRITGGWDRLQGPFDLETAKQYEPYFAKETLKDHYAHVAHSGFSSDMRPVYVELKVAAKKPKTGRPNPNRDGSMTREEILAERSAWIAEKDKAELANLWHLSNVPTSGTKGNRQYERMLWTSKEFSKAHPEYSSTKVYKWLEGWLAHVHNPGMSPAPFLVHIGNHTSDSFYDRKQALSYGLREVAVMMAPGFEIEDGQGARVAYGRDGRVIEMAKQNPQGVVWEGVACQDCTVAIANDDYSGFSDAQEKATRKGIDRLSKKYGWLVIGDELGFTNRGCSVCGSGLAGDKHEVSALNEVQNPQQNPGPYSIINYKGGKGGHSVATSADANMVRQYLKKHEGNLDNLTVWHAGKETYPGLGARNWLEYNNYLRSGKKSGIFLSEQNPANPGAWYDPEFKSFYEIGYYEKLDKPDGDKNYKFHRVESVYNLATDAEAYDRAQEVAQQLGHSVVLTGRGSPYDVPMKRGKRNPYIDGKYHHELWRDEFYEIGTELYNSSKVLGPVRVIGRQETTGEGQPKYQYTVERITSTGRKRPTKRSRSNPAPESAALFESFHGTPSTTEEILVEEERYHGNLAELGVLVSLTVETVAGDEVKLGFGDGDGDEVENPGLSFGGRAKYAVAAFTKDPDKSTPSTPYYWSEGSWFYADKETAQRHFNSLAKENYSVTLADADGLIDNANMPHKDAVKRMAQPRRQNPKGPFGRASQFAESALDSAQSLLTQRGPIGAAYKAGKRVGEYLDGRLGRVMSNPEYPKYKGENLSWSIGLYMTQAEAEKGYPRAKTVIKAMLKDRPEQLEKERREMVKASFGIHGRNATKELELIESLAPRFG